MSFRDESVTVPGAPDRPDFNLARKLLRNIHGPHGEHSSCGECRATGQLHLILDAAEAALASATQENMRLAFELAQANTRAIREREAENAKPDAETMNMRLDG
jgi:hypothetical protein